MKKKKNQLPPQIQIDATSLLSESQHTFLRNQTFSLESPGSIIQDFQTVLDFIGEGIPVSNRNQHFSRKTLIDLNQKLTTPLSITKSQPVQTTLPNLNGQYVLLRASGMALIQSVQKKFYLTIDPEVLDSWHSLNPIEKYFSLRETWWCWGTNEIFGGYNSPVSYPVQCLQFHEKIHDAGPFTVTKNDMEHFRYFPGMHNIALMEMFGFIEIQHEVPHENKQGWIFSQIQTTLWGEVIFSLLSGISKQMSNIIQSKEFQKMNPMLQEAEDFDMLFETSMMKGTLDVTLLLDYMKSLFPNYENHITLPEMEYQHGLFTFKVLLDNKTWRRVALPDSCVLDDLAEIILEAYDFDLDHLYDFRFKSRFGIEEHICHPDIGDVPPFTDEIPLGDLPLREGDSMMFVYDYGDWWQFQVLLESIDPGKTRVRKPKILNSKGKAPKQYGDYDEELNEEAEIMNELAEEFLNMLNQKLSGQYDNKLIPFPQQHQALSNSRNSSKKKKTSAKRKSSSKKPQCGLCGNTENLIKTLCCDQWICNDADQYVMFSYARNSCYQNHDRYTLCSFHHHEQHLEKDWRNCSECKKSFDHEMEMYVEYGTNEYNFVTLKEIPDYKPTHCAQCNRIIPLADGGYSIKGDQYYCHRCIPI